MLTQAMGGGARDDNRNYVMCDVTLHEPMNGVFVVVVVVVVVVAKQQQID
jgi:hypothetical protein